MAERLPETPRRLLLDQPDLADLARALEQSSQINPTDRERVRALRPDNTAYVIYTSGSTGRPKGAAIEHKAIVNRLEWMREHYGIGAGDRILQKTPASFDVSVWEFFLAPIAGATLVVAPPDSHKDPAWLASIIREQGITTIHFVPSMLEQFLAEPAARGIRLCRVFCSGEELPGQLRDRFHAVMEAELHNLYGPTEAAVDVSYWRARPDDESVPVPIGAAVWNTQLYVLNEQLQPMPVGVGGELYLGGVQLARGYLKRAGLTGERFVADPYGEAGRRMYRTGDLARWRRDGNLEFLGRADEQVKIRGFRVELGEIEAAQRELPEVAQAAVVVRADRAGEKRLVGYVVPTAGGSIDVRAVRQWIAQRLPEYMVPSAIVEMEALPLTPNGKLDRKGLPEPELISSDVYRAPRSPKEEILCSLFGEMLGQHRVGIDDNFFELGGHSLLATRLVSRVRAALGVEVAIRMLFESPTVALLAPRLRNFDKAPPLVRQQRPERLPLSYAQHRLWFLDRLGEASTEYNMPCALRLCGKLDCQALEKTINTIISRHESLRTHFAEIDGEPLQVIEPELQIKLLLEDLSGPDEEKQQAHVMAALREEASFPFDLACGPLLRMRLLKLGEGDHLLLRTMHHIVSDGWSEGVFNRELSLLYEAYCEGRENPLKPLSVQYADFALWQRQWLEQEVLAGGLGYWKEQLAGIPERLELPTDRVRPPVQSFAAELCQVSFSREQTSALKQLSQSQQATLYMVLLTGFGVLLERYSGQEEVLVGSPIANRQEAQLEEMIGFFVNTLVMKVGVDAEKSVGELVSEVRRVALEAYEHQDVPFERLVEELSPERSLNTTPIFQVVFALQNAPWMPERMKGLELEPVPGDEMRVKYDLEVHAWEQEGEIVLSWLYNRELFDRWRMEQMGRHYVRVLEAMSADAQRKIGSLELLGEEERRQILEEWNRTAREIPETTVVELFEQQVQRTPEAMAAVFGEQELTYGELNERANGLAHVLIGEGIGPEDVVALALPRSLEMIVALLGILKAGAAYLPIDPDYPAERVAFMLEDAEPCCVITTCETAQRLPERVRRLMLDQVEMVEALEQSPISNPQEWERVRPLRLNNPAYVIYTSGSTGNPKGVLIGHYSLANSTRARFHYYRDPVSRFLLASPFIFDSSVAGIYWTLCQGGTLLLPYERLERDPAQLARLMAESSISHLLCLPTLYSMLLEETKPGQINSLKCVIVAGEACPSELPERHSDLFADAELFNEYGPTEGTVWSSVYGDCSKLSRIAVPIGKPITNAQMYVLDQGLQPVPVGVAGELFIAGAGLARGYLKRPALTAERFVADPYGAPGTRIYRTGDLARWRADGNLEFMGRSDQQVKIRGFRVEPGEIEAALRELPEVAQAAVVAREHKHDEKLLVGYLVPAPGHNINPSVVRQRLAQHLPDYLVPAAIVELEALPLTPNGKVDRKALPQPQLISSDVYRAPRSPHEEILCSLFAEVLGVERVGIDDNFFQLGGHSLLATRLVSRVRAMLGVELAIRTLFESPSVAQLGRRLSESTIGRAALVRQQRPERLPLSYAQQRLWFLDRLAGGSIEYNMPVALRLRGELDRQALEKTINTIVTRHESLRTHFAEIEGEPVQVIEPELRIELRVEDLTALDEEERQVRVLAGLREEASQSFDLARGPLLRMKLFKLGERDHILLRTMHHIVSDGWSEGVFNRELAELYQAFCEGRENPLKPLTVQYADFTLWQRNKLEGGALDEGLKYWRQQLDGMAERLELPTDRVRPPVQSFDAELAQTILSVDLVERLKRLSQSQQATLYMTLLAGFGVLLERYSGQQDVVVGTPIANRQEAQLEEMIGFFVNTLVMRVKVDEEKRIEELVAEVRRVALEAYEHQDMPFERLVEELSPERSLNTTPIFQVIFALQNAPRIPEQMKGLELEPVSGDEMRVKYDLEVHAWEREGEIGFYWLYNRELFDGWRMEQMGRHYVRVVEAMAGDAQGRIGSIELLGEEERIQILEEWNRTAREIRETTVVELFELQVQRTPEAVAVVFGEQELNYRELNERANQLAHLLIGEGIGPEDVVGLAVPRSLEMIVALLGILKAGAAYLPIDLDYPAQRIAFMLADAEPAYMLTTGEAALNTPDISRCLILDHPEIIVRLAQSVDGNPGDGDRRSPLRPENPIYVIYTSGSTGVPKGVMMSAGGLTNLLSWQRGLISGGSGTKVAQFTALSFDVSAQEILSALTSGKTLIIPSNETRHTPAELVRWIEQYKVNELFAPTLVIEVLCETASQLGSDLKSLVEVAQAGEALTLSEQMREFYRHGNRRLYNHYGPTETHVATAYSLPPDTSQWPVSAAIGAPIWNIRVYVLDGGLRPVPMGVTGELYIAGVGLARGYLKRPALTGERFVADLYGGPGRRMYRTGDLARWRADGKLEFVGRSDEQVKIRGFRVEPGEIEEALREIPEVAQAAVVAREDSAGERRLVGYVVPAAGGSIDAGAVRQRIAQRLPNYMVPAAIVELDALPLTPNGKLDRRALPEPEMIPTALWWAPRNPKEEILCALFAEALKLERVGINDNFFELGGHSLLAARLMGRVRTTLGVELPIHSLFTAPTVAELALKLSHPTDRNAFEVMLPLRSKGNLPPLFCIHPGGGLSWCYTRLMHYIGADCPIYGLQSRHFSDPEFIPQTVEEMAADYIDQYPQDPTCRTLLFNRLVIGRTYRACDCDSPSATRG